MTPRTASVILPSRRRLLRAGAGLATLAAFGRAGAADEVLSLVTTTTVSASPPQVAFLDPAAAADALAHVPGDTYYDRMSLPEIRARMLAPLADRTLAQAREDVRRYDADAVLPWADDERAALRGVIERMQLLLAARAPRYARTPWSFIQLADRAEGGMPHTRGPHIVLPRAAVTAYADAHRKGLAAGTLDKATFGRSLLLHEQTHVLERQDPAAFEPLFTQVFGFTRMANVPTTPWLDAHVVTNPDGPDAEWAFPLEKIGGHGWAMPCVTLPDVAQPRMPRDFQSVAVEVEQTTAGWRVLEDDGVPRRRDLDAVPGWHAWFPFADEDFHPNETAAVALAHWILQDVSDVETRPRMPGLAAWAKTALA